MDSLIEFFDRYIAGSTEGAVYDNGFRRRSHTLDQLRETAAAFGGRLASAGLTVGDRVVIWSDSRPEWVAAFWGCMLCGVTVIPVDAGASRNWSNGS